MNGRDRTRFGWLLATAATLGLLAAATRLKQFAPRLAGLRHEDGWSARGQPSTPPSADARAEGHETAELKAGLLAKLVLLLGSAAFAMVFAMIGLRSWVTASQNGSLPPMTALQTTAIPPPKPNLQTDPVAELAALRAAEAKQLYGYAYLDKDKSRARIPIGQAMTLTVGAGLEPPP